jgi:capsular polysaccharide biosynthesis protein
MRRLAQFVAKLYPAWWRTRYGAEFNALLEDAKPAWLDLPNILKGAIEMQMSIWSRAAVAVTCAVAGTALAFGASFFMTPKYESSATFVLAGPGLPQLDVKEVRNQATLTGIIEARGLYQRERSRQSMDAVFNMMNRAIRVSPISPNVVKVSFTYEDAALAQATAMDLARQFIKDFQVKALDVPNLPRHPVSPSSFNMAIFGLGGGLLLGLVLLVILPGGQPRVSLPISRSA